MGSIHVVSYLSSDPHFPFYEVLEVPLVIEIASEVDPI